ncbi:hypothetical protein ACLOJK_005024 [Asimina triloba]
MPLLTPSTNKMTTAARLSTLPAGSRSLLAMATRSGRGLLADGEDVVADVEDELGRQGGTTEFGRKREEGMLTGPPGGRRIGCRKWRRCRHYCPLLGRLEGGPTTMEFAGSRGDGCRCSSSRVRSVDRTSTGGELAGSVTTRMKHHNWCSGGVLKFSAHAT